MSELTQLSRRRFLQLTGLASGGVMLAASLEVRARANALIDMPAGLADQPLSMNLFVQIAADGQVYIVAHRSEMGQGSRTGLPQIVADELEADWAKVTVVQGMANNAFGSQNTDGSRSVRDFYNKMREMGATARSMLEQAAAAQWQVPVAECQARDHRVHHSASKRSLGFGELAEAAAKVPMPKPETLRYKSDEAFKYIGKPVPVVDLHDFVTGDTTYGLDVDLPGIVYASIQRCPILGGELKSLDSKAALAVAGVSDVIKIDRTPLPAAFSPITGVAVIANNTWAANQGRAKLKLEWDAGPNGSHDSDAYLETLKQSLQSEGETIRAQGDVDKAFSEHSQHVEAQYTVPYIAHAMMEPVSATAIVTEEGAEIWACTQTPQSARDTVAGALGLDKEKVKVHVTLLGGGFGRKSKPDYCVEAALLSKNLGGKPVKVSWTREDDLQFGFYHSISAQRYRAALDKKGKVKAFEGHTAFPSIGSNWDPSANKPADFELDLGFTDMPYAIDNIKLARHEALNHVRIGWVRSVSNIHHAFAINSFADELAIAAKKDSREFMLDLLGEDRNLDVTAGGTKYGNYGAPLDQQPIAIGRLKGVLEAATRSAGWGKKTAANEGWGLAVHRSFVSYAAMVTRVALENGKVVVKEVHCALDAGLVVNPDRVKSQMEGAVIFGLSIALMGEVKVKDGAVVTSNFHDYPVLRMNQSPDIHVTLVRGSDIPGGVGEPGVPPVMASVTNAIVAAGGPRIRDLPISKHLQV